MCMCVSTFVSPHHKYIGYSVFSTGNYGQNVWKILVLEHWFWSVNNSNSSKLYQMQSVGGPLWWVNGSLGFFRTLFLGGVSEMDSIEHLAWTLGTHPAPPCSCLLLSNSQHVWWFHMPWPLSSPAWKPVLLWIQTLSVLSIHHDPVHLFSVH